MELCKYTSKPNKQQTKLINNKKNIYLQINITIAPN